MVDHHLVTRTVSSDTPNTVSFQAVQKSERTPTLPSLESQTTPSSALPIYPPGAGSGKFKIKGAPFALRIGQEQQEHRLQEVDPLGRRYQHHGCLEELQVVHKLNGIVQCTFS